MPLIQEFSFIENHGLQDAHLEFVGCVAAY